MCIVNDCKEGIPFRYSQIVSIDSFKAYGSLIFYNKRKKTLWGEHKLKNLKTWNNFLSVEKLGKNLTFKYANLWIITLYYPIFLKSFFVEKMQWNLGAIFRHFVVFSSCCHCFSSILSVDASLAFSGIFSSSKIVLTTILNELNFDINKNVRCKQNVWNILKIPSEIHVVVVPFN